MANSFKSGDIVQLKSGGPAMTVSGHSSIDKDSVDCTWFKGASRQAGRFAALSLKMFEPPKKDD